MKIELAPLALAFALSLSLPAQALEVAGVKIADHVKVAGKELVLNGTGMRKATFLKVKVYVGALYLEHPAHDAEAIANSDEIKSMELAFVRDVGAKDIAKAWNEGFENNCVTGCEAMKPLVARLQAMQTEMKSGEREVFNFLPGKVEVQIRGATVGTIEGKDFSHNLLRCWIGKNPPNEELKSGLLGEKG